MRQKMMEGDCCNATHAQRDPIRVGAQQTNNKISATNIRDPCSAAHERDITKYNQTRYQWLGSCFV